MSNPYKYYTKEEYLKYGDILETTEQIEARLKRHQNNKLENYYLSEQYRKEWEERTFETKIYKYYNPEECDFI